MIYYTKDITKQHAIESVLPDIIIKLPLGDLEKFLEKNVTCIFYSYPYLNPGILHFLDIDFYEEINNEILNNVSFNTNYPNYVYIFKGKPFDIDFIRKKLSNP